MNRISAVVLTILFVACGGKNEANLVEQNPSSALAEYEAEFQSMTLRELDQWMTGHATEVNEQTHTAVAVYRDRVEKMDICEYAVEMGEARRLTGALKASGRSFILIEDSNGQRTDLGLLKYCTRARISGDVIEGEDVLRLINQLIASRQPVQIEVMMWGEEIGLITNVTPHWRPAPCPTSTMDEPDFTGSIGGIMTVTEDGVVRTGGVNGDPLMYTVGQLTDCTEIRLPANVASFSDLILQGIRERVTWPVGSYYHRVGGKMVLDRLTL